MTKLLAIYFILLSFCATGFVTSSTKIKKKEIFANHNATANTNPRFKMDSVYDEKYFESTIGIPEERVVAVP